MKKDKWTFVFESFEIQDIISRYGKGESLKAIASSYNVSRPTIGRVLKENGVAVSHIKRNSIEFITDSTIKICPRCRRVLPLQDYNFGNGRYGRRSICRECEHETHNTPEMRARRQKRREERRKNEPGYIERELQKNKERLLSNEISYKKRLVVNAKARAKKKKIPFDITFEDFDIPEVCPLLGIKLNSHMGEPNANAQADSPSLDRILPQLGYVKGNVWVISNRANMIKSNASLEELTLLTDNLRQRLIH